MGAMEPENTPAVEGEGEAEVWNGPPQEEWEQVTAFLGSLQQAMEAPAQAEPQQSQNGDQQPQIDPFAEDFQSRLDQYIEQKMAPVQELTQAASMAEASERQSDIIADLQAQHGEFMLSDSAALAEALANKYINETQQQYGFGPQAAEKALELAYNDVKAREEAIGKAYHERQMNQLSTLSHASREPAVGTTSVQQVSSTKGNEQDLVRAYFTPATGR